MNPSVVEGMGEEEGDNVLKLTIKFLMSQHPQLRLNPNYKYVTTYVTLRYVTLLTLQQ